MIKVASPQGTAGGCGQSLQSLPGTVPWLLASLDSVLASLALLIPHPHPWLGGCCPTPHLELCCGLMPFEGKYLMGFSGFLYSKGWLHPLLKAYLVGPPPASESQNAAWGWGRGGAIRFAGIRILHLSGGHVQLGESWRRERIPHTCHFTLPGHTCHLASPL